MTRTFRLKVRFQNARRPAHTLCAIRRHADGAEIAVGHGAEVDVSSVMSGVAMMCDREIILLGHHPDLARRRIARLGLVQADDRCVALAWNVFRTLELVAPAFWLRRFRARLIGVPAIESGSRSLTVRLWPTLMTPPGRLQDDPVPVDAIVETEAAVYGVMAFDRTDVGLGDSTPAAPDAVLRTIDAVSWYAGVRDCYVALITSDSSDTPVGVALIDRYGSSRDALIRRLPHRRDELMNVRGIGRITWRDMASIIRDCAEAGSLGELERFAAEQTSRWLDSLGVHPVD